MVTDFLRILETDKILQNSTEDSNINYIVWSYTQIAVKHFALHPGSLDIKS